MSALSKLLAFVASQTKKSDVKLLPTEKPHKIQDDNQSIHNGVINETTESGLRGESQPVAKRKRGRPAKRST